jgi:lipopolysaccharide heptosyltransferase II
MTNKGSWEMAKNILCVRLDALGDVLMTTPAIRSLKQTGKGRRITLLTSSIGGEVAAMGPEIDHCMVYDAPWVKATIRRATSLADHVILQRLRQRRFDAAVIFTVYSQNPLPAALLCYLADIPLRLAHCRENPYQLLTHHVPELEPERIIRHEVRRQLDLVASVGIESRDEAMRLHVPESAREFALEALRAAGIDPLRPWLVVHPGASAPSRRYPPESYADAVRTLAIEDGLQIVFTGTNEESELVDSIRDRMGAGSRSLAGRLNLPEFAGLLSLAPMLLSNNTGPIHIASAVGTAVVDLYALTNPQHTPWGVPHRLLFHDVPCKYCYKSVCPEKHHDCLRLVSAEQVVRACRELMAEIGDARPVEVAAGELPKAA